MTVPLRTPPRRDPDVASIARQWRELTSGRTPGGRLGPGAPTLIACSAGADSSALVLALSASTRSLVVAHVVHDLRPEPDALADRDAARALADALAIPFAEARISTRTSTVDGTPARLPPRAADRNPEALARRLRYLALERLARAHSLRFIATAHHAGDQLESILMALARGAGPRGLRGVLPSRPVTPGSEIRVIRPALAIPRASLERLCRDAGWTWREDVTNTDTSRLRSFMRHEVIPRLRAARPTIEQRAATTAALLADASTLIHARATLLLANGPRSRTALAWSRAALRPETDVVLGELLRLAIHELDPTHPLDRLGFTRIHAVIACIRSPRPHARAFALAGVRIDVGPREVRMHAPPPTPPEAATT